MREEYSEELASLNGRLTEARLRAAPYRQRLAQLEGAANVKKTECRVLMEQSNKPREEAEELERNLDLKHHLHSEHIQAFQAHQQHLKEQQCLADRHRAQY